MDRALIWAGYGIRLADQKQQFREFVEKTQIPVVTTWTAADLIPTDHPLNIGIVGISGQRGANKAVHNCEFLLTLGSHLSPPQTSTLFSEFAPKAYKLVVNLDKDQLENLTVEASTVRMDLRDFFKQVDDKALVSHGSWLDECQAYKSLNRVHHIEGSYVFNDMMTKLLPEGSTMVVDGGGVALYTGFQSSHIKENQRLICSSSMSAMGSGIPEAVGAAFSTSCMTTILIGDGSLMLNLQELQTIRTHHLPVKIFVLNNNGYLAIKQTQDGFLGGRRCGVGGPDLEFPKLSLVAQAFDICYLRFENEETIKSVLAIDGPVICEVKCPENQPMLWKQNYKDGKPQNLGEMWPF